MFILWLNCFIHSSLVAKYIDVNWTAFDFMKKSREDVVISTRSKTLFGELVKKTFGRRASSATASGRRLGVLFNLEIQEPRQVGVL
jgi:hypothetical protein